MDEFNLTQMTVDETDAVVDFVGENMNADEREYAKRTIDFHFSCKHNNLDDGRIYFLWRKSGILCGLVGLHNYVWGPKENVWLGWFAVAKQFRRQGNGKSLVSEIEKVAYKRWFRKLYVETYSSSDFDTAVKFYRNTGFELAGTIQGYMSDGADMLIFFKALTE